MSVKKQIVFLSNGHQMNKEVYEKRKEFYAKLITEHKAVVINTGKPEIGKYDYNFVIKGLQEIPKELHEKFARSGVVAKLQNCFWGFNRIELTPR